MNAPSKPPKGGRLHLRGRALRRLGWIFLLAGIVLLLVGTSVLASTAQDRIDQFTRVSFADGSRIVNFTRTGTWVAYYESPDVSVATERIPDFDIAVSDSLGPLPLQPYGRRSDGKIERTQYDSNGHRGVAAFQFTIRNTGVYRVDLAPGRDDVSDADIAFGRDIDAPSTAGTLTVVPGGLLVVAGVVLLIVGRTKKRQHLRELRFQPGGLARLEPGYTARRGGDPPGGA